MGLARCRGRTCDGVHDGPPHGRRECDIRALRGLRCFEPLGITIHADDDVAEEFLNAWASRHLCGDLNTTGLLLFGTNEDVNRAFGLDL